MKIAALHKTSLIDFPGLISAVVFTQGCNLRCGYCHNPHLLDYSVDKKYLPESEVLSYLKIRQSLIEGVVVTGGEPTLQPDLMQFIAKVKHLGYRIKLDTNGTQSKVLEKLIKSQLLNFVALDVKAPPGLYNKICGMPVDLKAITTSIKLLQESGIDYEFRTTLSPELGIPELTEILTWIDDSRHWVLQKCRSVNHGLGGQPIFSPVFRNTANLENIFVGCKLRGL